MTKEVLLNAKNQKNDKSNYIYGTGLLYENDKNSTDKTLGKIFYHYNNLGSTTKLTNESGEIVEKFTYGTYGELLSGDSLKTEYLYNGMYGVRTDENGLYHMRARFYNTEIKRFINQDILRGELTNTQSLNRYSYVQGNPVSYTDPFGLSTFKKFSDGVHTVLNLVGMECGWIGALADLANAGLYYLEGDTKMASLCVVSALPVAGNAVSGALTAMKCAKAAKIVTTATRAVSNATNFAVASIEGAGNIKNIYNNIKNGRFFTWDNLGEAGKFFLNVYTASVTGKSLSKVGKSYAGNKAKKFSKVKESGSKEIKPNQGQGFSTKGYNPTLEERTFEGYVNNNVSRDVETKLFTNSSYFNTNSKHDGHFKRFGTKPNQHGIEGAHVHQPTRNINPNNGVITGKPGKETKNGGVTVPGAKDVKQLYEYLENGKYH